MNSTSPLTSAHLLAEEDQLLALNVQRSSWQQIQIHRSNSESEIQLNMNMQDDLCLNRSWHSYLPKEHSKSPPQTRRFGSLPGPQKPVHTALIRVFSFFPPPTKHIFSCSFYLFISTFILSFQFHIPIRSIFFISSPHFLLFLLVHQPPFPLPVPQIGRAHV